MTHAQLGAAVPTSGFITYEEVYRLVVVQKYGTLVTCMNAFHFGSTTVGGSANTLAVDFRDYILPTWKANVANSMTFNEVYAYQIAPFGGPVASALASGTGTVVEYGAPVVIAGVITWRTPGIGRSSRGRTFIAGMTLSSGTTSDGVNWNASGQARLGNIANAILTRYNLSGSPPAMNLVVYSRKWATGGTPGASLTAAYNVNRYTIPPYMATMGSRRGGRGI
jgi:hypothetical protein